MKSKKFLIIIFISLIILNLTGCNDLNAAKRRYVQDRSDQLENIPISDTQFKMEVINIITPIIQTGYNLNINAQKIKMGNGDIANEIKNIEEQIQEVQNTRNKILSIKVSKTKEFDKQNLIKSLDNYSTKLNNYRLVLLSQNLTKQQIQLAIDNLMTALDSIKQYIK